jgi:hypothetical protein
MCSIVACTVSNYSYGNKLLLIVMVYRLGESITIDL